MKANEELYKKRLISKQEYDDSRAKYSSAAAALEQAKASLEIAKSNLYSTTIRSPIDGVVISKNANVGQTVTAGPGLSPLFLIAEDLTRMQLNANVSEADIGKVKEGQGTFFTVDAYPNQTFRGEARQIRNAPIITNNVVTYDVVILVDNKDLKLKPGMTADVRILVARKEDVLRVPRAALRFIPPPSALIDEKSKELNSGVLGSYSEGGKSGNRGVLGSYPEGGKSGNRSSVVWTVSQDGKLRAVSIKPGISDDNFTEILDGDLKKGEEVIVEAIQKSASGSEPLGPIVLPKPQRF